jgi:hypothetical protein
MLGPAAALATPLFVGLFGFLTSSSDAEVYGAEDVEVVSSSISR